MWWQVVRSPGRGHKIVAWMFCILKVWKSQINMQNLSLFWKTRRSWNTGATLLSNSWLEVQPVGRCPFGWVMDSFHCTNHHHLLVIYTLPAYLKEASEFPRFSQQDKLINKRLLTQAQDSTTRGNLEDEK